MKFLAFSGETVNPRHFLIVPLYSYHIFTCLWGLWKNLLGCLTPKLTPIRWKMKKKSTKKEMFSFFWWNCQYQALFNGSIVFLPHFHMPFGSLKKFIRMFWPQNWPQSDKIFKKSTKNEVFSFFWWNRRCQAFFNGSIVLVPHFYMPFGSFWKFSRMVWPQNWPQSDKM